MVLVSKGTYFEIGIFKFSTSFSLFNYSAPKICKTQKILESFCKITQLLNAYILTVEKYSMGFIQGRKTKVKKSPHHIPLTK